ncbi:MAG: hypothetical protein AMXMBFR34_34430 [Myxococcaceae bacterium]
MHWPDAATFTLQAVDVEALSAGETHAKGAPQKPFVSEALARAPIRLADRVTSVSCEQTKARRGKLLVGN